MQRELITFEVAGQIFGLDIMAIREIRAWSPPTRLPRVPGHVAGVVNLRGAILPVIDLAVRLGWPGSEPTPRHAMIVTQLCGQLRGLIVDSVRDIVTVAADAVQAPPTIPDSGVEPFLDGLVALEDRMIMVLDLAALNAEEIAIEAA